MTKISDFKPGDLLITDGRFTCMPDGYISGVKCDNLSGALYVKCDFGEHYLGDFAASRTGKLSGMRKPTLREKLAFVARACPDLTAQIEHPVSVPVDLAAECAARKRGFTNGVETVFIQESNPGISSEWIRDQLIPEIEASANPPWSVKFHVDAGDFSWPDATPAEKIWLAKDARRARWLAFSLAVLVGVVVAAAVWVGMVFDV